MRLEYILTMWLLIIAIMMVLWGSKYVIKPKELESLISIKYDEGRLIFELNTNVKVYSLTVFPGNMTYDYNESIYVDRCPTAVILDTNRGYYKVFGLKC
ncbi:MAG: hypothetical protein QW336_02925 [Candidatus Anstonellales archaeon]